MYFYTYLDTDFGAAADSLRTHPERWLPAPATVDGDGEAWEVELRADGVLPPKVAGLGALVSVGDAAVHDDRVLLTIRWRSRSAERLFPVLEGDLDLQHLEGTSCHLSLTGTYRPPLSVVGGAGDKLIGHRVAEACVRRFVLDVAERLQAQLAPAP